MRPLASAPPAAPLPGHSEVEGRGGLVVLLLAERAPSEGPHSTRAIEDQPGHLPEKQTSKLGGIIVRWTPARNDKPRRSGASRSMPHASLRVWKLDRLLIDQSRFSDRWRYVLALDKTIV
jgi:hypothetical protein